MRPVGNNKPYYGKNGCCVDHLGNFYSNVCTMCDIWGVNYYTFNERIANGWSLAKALTHGSSVESPRKDENVLWVFGEPYPSYTAVDIAYGFTSGISAKHKDNLEEWLNSQYLFYVDDKLFRSYTELAFEYGVSENLIMHRVHYGWTLYDAVHTPPDMRGRAGKRCTDHLGYSYDTKRDMCLHYGITTGCLNGRLKRGIDLETALTTPMQSRFCVEMKKVAKSAVTS